ncbi:hypothetical protein [Halomonas sp. M20]|uniref:hypothetical protein n=1 Tax=Halomonas sp. M20 TaxID=2763264 RepID=UPI001D0BE28C|nr:hypothetical protein [Halomonas sp. M20]
MKLTTHKARALLILLTAIIQTGLVQTAQAHVVLSPFEATYSLVIKGWPDTRIHHRLSDQGVSWQSEMSASIATARGDEHSRFRLEGDTVDAQSYSSGYRFLGFGDRYELDASELSDLPDRQTALFILSRDATTARCTHNQVAPCSLRFLNHKGEETMLKYRVAGSDQVTVPAGTFPRITVDAWDPDKPDRHLIFGFHTGVPGLMLSFEYQSEGERKSHLTLSRLTLGNS